MNIMDMANCVQTYCISYDLQPPATRHEELAKTIAELGSWWHQGLSVWIVATDLKPNQIMKRLEKFLNKGDKLCIFQVINDYALYGQTEQEKDWCRAHIHPLID